MTTSGLTLNLSDTITGLSPRGGACLLSSHGDGVHKKCSKKMRWVYKTTDGSYATMPARHNHKSEGAQTMAVMGEKMGELATSRPLWKRVGELGASSAFLLYLADVGSDRLSATQLAFFMLAATADAAGKPATRTELLAAYRGRLGESIRNSYRQFLEPSRRFPRALGWLTTDENPDDAREQFLRLTKKGQQVIEGALLALEPVKAPSKRRTQ